MTVIENSAAIKIFLFICEVYHALLNSTVMSFYAIFNFEILATLLHSECQYNCNTFGVSIPMFYERRQLVAVFSLRRHIYSTDTIHSTRLIN